MTAHVVVVGGGVAGLVMARELAIGGVRVTLVEASDRLGGKVQPHTVGGIELDAGAESFASRGGTVAALATELGLGPSIVTPTGSGAWLQPASGNAMPLPSAGLLGIPSVPLSREVIAIVGTAGALRAQLDGLMLGFVGSKERSLGRLVRKRMGHAVLDRLVAPVATAIHSAHPDDLDVDVVAPRLRTAVLSEGSLAKAVLTLRGAAPAGAAVQGIDGGVFRLVEAIVADLAARDDSVEIVLNTHVTQADVAGVVLADGSRHPADRVVLATAINQASETPGDPIILATLVVAPSPELDAAPRGTGVLVAAGAPRIRAKALTHATAKWAWIAHRAKGAHVLRLSYSTAPADDKELREQARTDAALLLGVRIPASAVLAFDRQEWTGPAPRGVRQDSAPSGEEPLPGDDPGAETSVIKVGERISGTGLAAVIAHTRREAGSLLRDLGGRAALGLEDS